MALFFTLFIPFAAALLSLIPRKRIASLEVIAGCAGCAWLVSTLAVSSSVLREGTVGLTRYFSVDAFGVILMLVVATIGCAASFYSIGYLREEVKKEIIGFQRVRQYYFLFHVFVAAMLWSIAAASPIFMWIVLELTTISTIFLISFYNRPTATEAAWKYLLINSIGLLLGFFGTLLFLTASVSLETAGHVSWATLFSSATNLHPVIAQIAFIFVLIGYGTKVGLAPMHTWLPDAHGNAPSPISALLSGALLNIAFLAIFRFKTIADAAIGSPAFTQNLLIAFGVASLAIAAFIIFVQKKYKRLFAYSSIEHMGIIAIGFGFGGIAAFAAVLHMIYHSLAKSVLFFASGNIVLKYVSTSIEQVKGLSSTLPVTAPILLIAFLAIAGVPPFGIFTTEFMILTAGIADHLTVVIVMLFLLTLVFVGFFRHIVSMTFGNPPAEMENGEASMFTVVPLVVLIAIFAVLSVYLPPSLQSLIRAASGTAL